MIDSDWFWSIFEHTQFSITKFLRGEIFSQMRHRMGHGFEPPVLSITVSVSWLWRAKSKVRLFSALSQCSFSSTFKALCCIRSVHSVVSCFSRPSYTFSQALVCLALLLLLNVRNEVLSNYKLTRIPARVCTLLTVSQLHTAWLYCCCYTEPNWSTVFWSKEWASANKSQTDSSQKNSLSTTTSKWRKKRPGP